MAKTALVINSGSSSIKYQLVDLDSQEGIVSGLVEKIGEAGDGHYVYKYNGEKHELEEPIPDHETGLKRVLGFFKEFGPDLKNAGIVAVGHRVVQGGSVFPKPAFVNAKTIQQVKDLAVLAPLHNGPEAIGAEVMLKLLPDVPQAFVFDSSYFFQLPEEASTYALNKQVEGLKQIVLHVGNGASASAQISGKPIDTSMGLTPLEGLVMGGRTGDIDPAAVFHLIRNAHMDVDQLDELFNKKSGLAGLCGHSDMREVHALVAEGDKDAKLALDVYVHRIIKYIGDFTAQMGGVDAITFTAGVGENDDIVRKMVCDRLAPFGVKIDEEKNATRSKDPRIISTPDSSVFICVIPTNEELAIAQKVTALAEAGVDSYGNKVGE